MSFQRVCENVLLDTEGGLGCLLIDLQSDLTLALAKHSDAYLGDAEVGSLLTLCSDMFRGKLIDQFVRSLRTEASSADFVQEVQIATAHTYQFMATIPDWDGTAVILITDKSRSLGLGWIAVRQAREQLALVKSTGTFEDPPARHRPPEASRSRYAAPARQPITAPGSPIPPRDDAGPGRSRQAPAQPQPQPQPPKASPQPAAESIPNPMFDRRQQSVQADVLAAQAEKEKDAEPEAQPFLGPRARMFRSAKAGKKRR